MGKISIIWIVLGLLFFSLSNAFGATIHVPADQPTIQAGIDAAVNGDTVLVAEGTYNESQILLRGKILTIASNYIFDSLQSTIESTIIDGNQNGSIFFISGGQIGQTIIGFTLTEGSGTIRESPPIPYGGAFQIVGSGPTIKHNIIINNSVDGYGGAIYLEWSKAIIADNIIRNNNANRGGGIFIKGGDSSLISGNQFIHNMADSGGAIYNWVNDGSIITNCIFAEDSAYEGGAIYCSSASPRIEHSTMINNQAKYQGGAVYLFRSFARIDSCIIQNNRAVNGAGIYCWESNGNITHCLIKANIASNIVGGGGGLYCDGSLKVANCTVVNNSATYGGGLDYLNAEPNIENAIICSNTAPYGAGIWHGGSLYNANIKCCDISNNYGGASCKGDNCLDVDPEFCNESAGDYHLISTSPCAPTNNLCGTLIGAFNVRCAPITIGILNDQMSNVTAHLPQFYWPRQNYDGLAQDSFSIEIGADSNWNFAEMWDSGPVASADTSIAYAGASLIDGATYYLRLRVHNGSVWSLWYDTTFRMNSVPSVPVLTWPDSGAIVNTATPTLYVHNATDAENDTINYEFAVVNDSAFGQLNEYGVSGFPEEIDSTGWQVFQSLNENWKYWWRSRAYDQYENSPWSSIKSFWVNAVEEPPGLFNINPLPETTGTVFQMLPQFHWLASSDPDPLDSVHYTLYIALDSNFLYLRTIENIQSNSYQLADSLLFATRYWWKVKATDKTGRYTYSSNTLNFRTWKLGDANGDWLVNVQDVTFIINFLYNEGPAPKPKFVADINGTCLVNIQDITYLINYLYKGGPSPKIGCM